MLQNKIFDQAAMVTNRVDCIYGIRIYITIYSVAIYFVHISRVCLFFCLYYASMENKHHVVSTGMASFESNHMNTNDVYRLSHKLNTTGSLETSRHHAPSFKYAGPVL